MEFKAERSILRRYITEQHNKIQDGELLPNVSRIQDKASKLEILNQKILEAMKLDKLSEQAWEDEFSKIYVYAEKVNDLLDACNQQHSRPVVANHSHRQLRLPELQFNRFDGDIKSWFAFWAQYRRIHEDDSLDGDTKFQYLIQLLDGRALQFIRNYQPIEKNYDRAVQELQIRFANPDLLLNVVVRDIMNILLNQLRGNVYNLNTFYDLLQAQLNNLLVLELPVSSYTVFLVPLIEGCLPSGLLKQWDKEKSKVSRSLSLSSLSDVKTSNETVLDELMEFIKLEVESDEKCKSIRDSLDLSKGKQNLATTAVLTTTAIKESPKVDNSRYFNCLFCDKGHPVERCILAQKLSLEERKTKIKEKRACFRCLNIGHVSSRCKLRISCPVCSKSHLVILCPLTQQKTVTTKESHERANESVSSTLVCKVQEINIPTVYFQTIRAIAQSSTAKREVRILFDSAASKSYISKKCANDLKLQPSGFISLRHGLFGGEITESSLHPSFHVKLVSIYDEKNIVVSLIGKDIICQGVQPISNRVLLKELRLKGIELSDQEHTTSEIDILLGADFMPLLFTNNSMTTECGPMAIKTKFGWTVLGATKNFSQLEQSNICMTLFSISDLEPRLWDLDIIGIKDDGQFNEKNQDNVFRQIMNNITLDTSNRYQVRLPWKEECQVLSDNRNIALSRLYKVTEKLKFQKLFQVYDDIFEQWLRDEIIEDVPVNEIPDHVHYLPHRPIIKEASVTTRIRPVFDASCKGNGVSLNQCLETGPNLISRIPDIISRFRIGKIGMSCDIRKAFLQISLHPADRDFTRFLWWNTDGSIRELRHRRVIFGICSSPAHLGAVIQFHLQKNFIQDPECVNILQNSFYVDNVLTAFDSLSDLNNFKCSANKIMETAHFELAQWQRNRLPEDKGEPFNTISALGLLWDMERDVLFCQLPRVVPSVLSKRTILSVSASIFDILGFWCPVLVIPKKLLQETWRRKISWDEKLPPDLHTEFDNWLQTLPFLNQCVVPRFLCTFSNLEVKQLHIFCDASKTAYAAVAYLRTEDGNVNIKLVQARSRIAPIEKYSIPRLELLALLIGVRLGNCIINAMNLNNVTVTYWSDSLVALTWIRSPGPWTRFVQNRVVEIRNKTSVDAFRFVPGELNPADLPSRGCTAKELLKSNWFHGPSWLYDIKNWPRNEAAEAQEGKEEISVQPILALNNTVVDMDPLLLNKYFSNYFSIVKTVAWILRFKFKKKGKLTSEEILRAENVLFFYIQQNTSDLDNLHGLQITIDNDGIKRVITRLDPSIGNFSCPILLPYSHPLIIKLIFSEHLRHKHAGVLTLSTLLRQRFWLLKARRTIKSVLNKCVHCQRQRVKALQVPFSALPLDRTNADFPFQHTGIDMAGPLLLQNGDKIWIVIFTCSVFRAVHLELVQSASTEAFLQALRRFISRRGRISKIYSDNGGNFVGAFNCFNNIDWNKIEQESAIHRIQWHFNPATAAWWGGWWERLIRVVKDLLKRNLGTARIDYIELNTILCDIEYVINSRPLTYISDSPSDLLPLTPMMFIQPLPGGDTTDLDIIDVTSLNNRTRYLQDIRSHLRKRFADEYTAALVNRGSRKKQTIEVDDIVLIGSDNKARQFWPLGRVLELFPGRDKEVRVAKIKTQNGVVTRPLQRVYPLELDRDDFSDTLTTEVPPNDDHRPIASVDRREPETSITRCGRKIRLPARLDL